MQWSCSVALNPLADPCMACDVENVCIEHAAVSTCTLTNTSKLGRVRLVLAMEHNPKIPFSIMT